MKRIRIAIAGFGKIGSELAEHIFDHQQNYADRHGVCLDIAGVCSSQAGIVAAGVEGLSRKALADRGCFQSGLTGDAFLDASAADILVETGPTDYVGGEPGLSYARAAIARGMHVVFASKGAMLIAGSQLATLASEAGTLLKYRCAAASGLPAVDLLESAFSNSHILELEGMLTGTTGFILATMQSTGCTLEEAVAQAKKLGLSEPDPSNDISGRDTAVKLLIIANAVLGAGLSMDDVAMSGLENLTPTMISDWQAAGVEPRFIGRIRGEQGTYRADVGLRLLDEGETLRSVAPDQKALRIVSQEFGETLLVAGGSSPGATVAALMEDITAIIKNMTR